jgi:hypothetical protein
MLMSNSTMKERVLIIVLILLIIWGLGISLIVYPAYQSFLSKQLSLKSALEEEQMLQYKLMSAAGLDEQIQEAYSAVVENSKIFNESMDNYKVSKEMRELFTDRNIKIRSLVISDEEKTPLVIEYKPNEFEDVPIYKYAQDSSSQLGGIVHGVSEIVFGYKITVVYEGQYEDVKELIQDIYSKNKSVYVSGVTIDRIQGDSEELTMGVMNIVFYTIPPLVISK